nr:histone-like nucleoid-structuring protein Lsr2 [Pseudonocardia sp. AL041005-10]
MARVLIDDLTEDVIRTEDEGGTVRLTLDSDTWELDLTVASQDKLREVLAPYMAAGRYTPKPGTPKAAPGAGGAAGDEPSDADIRAWARQNNIEVGAIGRVKKSVRDAYLAATAGRADPSTTRPAEQGTAADPPPSPPTERPRPEQAELAEDLMARDVPTHLVASQTGLTVEQVRELRRELDRR